MLTTVVTATGDQQIGSLATLFLLHCDEEVRTYLSLCIDEGLGCGAYRGMSKWGG